MSLSDQLRRKVGVTNKNTYKLPFIIYSVGDEGGLVNYNEHSRYVYRSTRTVEDRKYTDLLFSVP